MGYCEAPDCFRETRGSRRYCNTHERRMSRGQPLDDAVAERLTPFGRFLEAAIALANAPSDDDAAFRRAKSRAQKAGRAWLLPLLASSLSLQRKRSASRRRMTA